VSAPFGRRGGEVIARTEVGPYVVIEVTDGYAPAEPGQFYMLAAAVRWGGGEAERPFLARALSALRAEDGTIAFMLDDVGPGTRRLSELEPGEEVQLVGPLGHGFTPPPDGREALLVGGGVGLPPLAMFQQRWGGRALLGFRDAEHALGATLLTDPEIATDDGSLGHHGLVTDLLDRELDAHAATIAIYSCGPQPMLSAIKARAGRYNVPTQLAVEAPMACGFGACYGCIVDTHDGYRRVCVDGPVFDATLLVA
jgi:NAD(P)H-flavin reductase